MLPWIKKDNPDCYWAIVFEPNLIQAGIWEIAEKQARVLVSSPVAIWETEVELIGAADTALSAAIQSLPEEVKEPTQAVFGVPAAWVDAGQIKPEFLEKIKKVCTEFSLTPAGFVVLAEAIAHLYKFEEKTALNAVTIGLTQDFLEITVFSLGNLVGTFQVSRSVSILDDSIEGLSRFSAATPLPSRIVLYDGKEGELAETKDVLTSADWRNLDKVKFLHSPKIEIFPPDKKVTAVSLAGAAELAGVEVITEKSLSNFESESFSEIDNNVVLPEAMPSAQELGFLIGEDVANQKKEAEALPSSLPEIYKSVETDSPAPSSPVASLPKSPNKTKFWAVIISLGEKIKKIFRKSQTVEAGYPVNRKRYLPWVLTITPAIVVAIFILGWIFIPRAEIKVYVFPKKFEEKVGFTLGEGEKISAEKVEIEVVGEKTKATTGTKRVGEKSKGTVKVQNGTASVINLAAKTLILSANSLEFETVESASIAAALSPSLPGTQVVEVIARDIGAEYNLGKDEIFKISNYPKAEVDGVAIADFSGGTSREISAVSVSDTESLMSELLEELSERAEKDLKLKLEEDQILIDPSLLITPVTKVFSQKVGDEALNLKLTLTVKAEAWAIRKAELSVLAKEVLKSSAPSGFFLKDEDLIFSFSKGENSDYFANIKANYLPDYDLASLRKKILGKSPEKAEAFFKEIPGFSRAEITFIPRLLLPEKLTTLPRISKNLRLVLESEK